MRSLEKQFGLAEEECKELAQSIERRSPALRWLPGIASVLSFFAWMFCFGRTTDALEGTAWDLLQHRALLPTLSAVLLGYGVAITLAVVSYKALRRTLLSRRLHYHLHFPACVWCSYILRGLEAGDAVIQCPECGRKSPVRT